RWFYGDSLFIVDIWLWSTLGFTIWRSRRRERLGQSNPALPALLGLGAVTIYAGATGAVSKLAEAATRTAVVAEAGRAPERVVANPVPVDPFRRRLVYQLGTSYGFGEYRFL